MTEHIPGYGYADKPKQDKSQQQYARALTALNDLAVIAHATSDVELYRAASEQINRLAEELRGHGLKETWHVDTQAYTVSGKEPDMYQKLAAMTPKQLNETWRALAGYDPRDWYDSLENITMDDWAQAVYSEMDRRGMPH